MKLSRSFRQKYKGGVEALCAAAKSGGLARIQALIDDGANVHGQWEPRPKDPFKRVGDKRYSVSYITPLGVALAEGRVEVVRLLLQAGVDVNKQTTNDNKNVLPLHCVANLGSVELMQLLLDHGANVQGVDYDGKTPLYSAAELGLHDIIHLLVDHGADVQSVDNNRNAYLHNATGDSVEKLIQLGRRVLAENSDGYQPLCTAIWRSDVGAVDTDTSRRAGRRPCHQEK
jgi:ankyrin repeat protein